MCALLNHEWLGLVRGIGQLIVEGVTGNVFLSAHGIKLRLSEGSVGRTLVGLARRETDVSALVQVDVMFDERELVEVNEGGDGAMTIMEFWTMEGYAI